MKGLDGLPYLGTTQNHDHMVETEANLHSLINRLGDGLLSNGLFYENRQGLVRRLG